MKIINLKKKIGASLLAIGMLTPGAAHAAAIDTNLVVDPSFESVDDGVVGRFGTRGLSAAGPWNDGVPLEGFTYRYDGTVGANPTTTAPSPGDRYFSANFGGIDGGGDMNADILVSGVVSQRVDLSAGDSAATIASGLATYSLSAWLGGFNGAASSAIVSVEFFEGGTSLSTGMIQGVPGPDAGGTGTGAWLETFGSGAIPVGTDEVEISVYSSNDNDGAGAARVDLVDFSVSAIPEPTSVVLAGLGILGMGAFSRKRKV